jgi:hypothetical protein
MGFGQYALLQLQRYTCAYLAADVSSDENEGVRLVTEYSKGDGCEAAACICMRGDDAPRH